MLLDREDREAIRVMGFLYWAWCRTGAYRVFMRWAHRYNWHHCTVMPMFEDGSVQHWCQWCGLRYQTKPIDYARVVWTDAELQKTFAYDPNEPAQPSTSSAEQGK